MKALLTLLMLWMGFSEDCTDKDILNKISQLGSPTYRVRETAQKQLSGMKKLPVRFVERTAFTHPDPEVRARCDRLFGEATSLEIDSYGIWDLPNYIRFPLGVSGSGATFQAPFDLSKYYYQKARTSLGGDKEMWRESNVQIAALQMLFTDLIRGGWTKKEIGALFAETKEFFKTHYWDTDYYDYEGGWQTQIPGVPTKILEPKE